MWNRFYNRDCVIEWYRYLIIVSYYVLSWRGSHDPSKAGRYVKWQTIPLYYKNWKCIICLSPSYSPLFLSLCFFPFCSFPFYSLSIMFPLNFPLYILCLYLHTKHNVLVNTVQICVRGYPGNRQAGELWSLHGQCRIHSYTHLSVCQNFSVVLLVLFSIWPVIMY